MHGVVDPPVRDVRHPQRDREERHEQRDPQPARAREEHEEDEDHRPNEERGEVLMREALPIA